MTWWGSSGELVGSWWGAGVKLLNSAFKREVGDL